MRVATAILIVFALGGSAFAGPSKSYIFFPTLAQAVLSGDASAFRKLLALADHTQPGERLEELAELSSRFVRLSPVEFLRGQAASSTCFGVEFMGPEYVDNPAAVAREEALRRQALNSVLDPQLTAVKDRCLHQLDGS